MNGVPAPSDAALSGNKKSSGRLSFFVLYNQGEV